jgi:FlaG/FlaF family flagellin (archaellin)
VVVQYDLKPWLDASGNFVPGTAVDSLSAFEEELPSQYYDYYIDGVSGQVTIPAGQTSAAIKVNVLSDFLWEDDETIEITLKSSNSVTVGTNNKMTITVEQEDGKVVQLDWPNGTTVDMDLFVWLRFKDDESNEVFEFPLAYGINADTEGPEVRIIPDVLSDQLLIDLDTTAIQYGGSYVYYEGNVNDLQFTVTLGDFQNGVASTISTKTGSYTTANINPWDTSSGTDPIIVQTFDYSGGNLVNITNITTPTSGSRVRTSPLGNVPYKVSKAPEATRKLR